MIWRKKGLIFSPNKDLWWSQHYGILPTPVHMPEKGAIRIFFATTCKDRFGRISFIDVDENNPASVLHNPEIISLSEGDLGAFDDCGVNPSTILREGNKWVLYYAGYQRHFRTAYSILSGMATSDDGVNFLRLRRTPVLERTTSELSLRSAPTVVKDQGIYKMWYVSDMGWKAIEGKIFNDKLMPTYGIKYGTSIDGVNWEINDRPVLIPEGTEFGFGRPYITITPDGNYRLYYSIRSRDVSYRIGFADSTDGINWTRKDAEIGIDVSEDGWDSEMICYAAVLAIKEKTFLFYNGNNNGETGFGFAELENE